MILRLLIFIVIAEGAIIIRVYLVRNCGAPSRVLNCLLLNALFWCMLLNAQIETVRILLEYGSWIGSSIANGVWQLYSGIKSH